MDLGNWGTAIQGFGTLAGAWGDFEDSKKRNKLLMEQFNYEKVKDANASAKLDKAQSSLDNAFENSVFNTAKKKKKNADGTEVTDDTLAAVSTSA